MGSRTPTRSSAGRPLNHWFVIGYDVSALASDFTSPFGEAGDVKELRR